MKTKTPRPAAMMRARGKGLTAVMYLLGSAVKIARAPASNKKAPESALEPEPIRKLSPANAAKGKALCQVLALTKPITEGKKIAIAKIAQLEGLTLAIVNMPRGTEVAIRLSIGICRRCFGSSQTKTAINKTPKIEFAILIPRIDAVKSSLANQLVAQ
jgi:hypothetical protein